VCVRVTHSLSAHACRTGVLQRYLGAQTCLRWGHLWLAGARTEALWQERRHWYGWPV